MKYYNKLPVFSLTSIVVCLHRSSSVDFDKGWTMHESSGATINKGETLTQLPDYRTKLGNVSTTQSAHVSAAAYVSIDYEESHVSNPAVGTTKRKRLPSQLQANKKQSIAISITELFGDQR